MKFTLSTILSTLLAFLSASSFAASPREVSERGLEGYRLFVRDSLPDDRAKGYAMMLDAAWEGDAKAANNIGWLLEQGEYVEKDLAGALRWYERASDQGLPAAALNYVNMLFHHPEALDGKEADIHRVAKASFIAGRSLAMGRGLHYDYRQGEDLLVRAALLGNEEAALTIAQQLEMYPDSFSYLPLQKIVEECEDILPAQIHIRDEETPICTLTEMMLTPEFWYSRIDAPAR